MAVYEFIPAPGQSGPLDQYTNPELLYSTEAGGFTQKGATVAGGQGVIPLGTCMALNTTTHKFVPYNGAGSNGTNVAAGLLRKSIDTARGDQVVNIVISGAVKLELVQGTASAIATALGGTINTAYGFLKF